jgi:protein RecA
MSGLNRLKVFKNAVNKEHGHGTIGLAATMRPLDIPRLTTGSLSFDVALGGGIPVGRTTMYWGMESSGKTTNALLVGANNQKLCAHCFRESKDYEVVQTVEEKIDNKTGEVLEDAEWVAKATCDCFNEGLFNPRKHPKEKDSEFKERVKGYKENSYEEFRVALVEPENTFDRAWARKLGLDDRLVYHVVPSTAEEAVDMYDELIRTAGVDLIILDSIAALVPSVEVEATMEDQQVGMQARLVNKFCRKVTAAVNDVSREYGRIVTQIWINQERAKIGVTFGSNKTMSGGIGQKFLPSVRVYMFASKWQKTDLNGELIEEHRSKIGSRVRMNFQVEKNKTAPSQGTGSFVLNVAGKEKGKIDELKFVMALAKKYGIFKEEGEGSKKKWILAKEEFSTKKACHARVLEPDVYVALKKSLQKRMLLGIKEL